MTCTVLKSQAEEDKYNHLSVTFLEEDMKIKDVLWKG